MNTEERNSLIERCLPLARLLADRMGRASGLVQPDELEDMFQEASLAVVRAAGAYDPGHESGASFLHYAWRAIRNTLVTWLADRGRAPVPIGLCSGEVEGHQRVERQQEGDRLERLQAQMDALPYDERSILKMRFGVDGCHRHSFRWIARKRDMTVWIAKRRVTEILEKLVQGALAPEVGAVE